MMLVRRCSSAKCWRRYHLYNIGGASSWSGWRADKSKIPTSSATRERAPAGFDDDGTDFAAFEALTDDDNATAARADPDTRAPNKNVSASARRVGLHGVIRTRLALTPAAFEVRYHIPAATVLAWERGTLEPDSPARALLALIAADQDGVAATLAKTSAPPQAVE